MTEAGSGCRCQPASPALTQGQPEGWVVAGASETLRAEPVSEICRDSWRLSGHGGAQPRYAFDLDSPRRWVKVSAFRLESNTVTKRQFAAFVAECGYRTTAEREGWSFVYAGVLPDPIAYLRHPTGTPWWR